MYIHQLQLDRAEPLVERAHELARESGSVANRGQALITEALLAFARGRLPEAEAALAAAAELYEDLGNPLYLAIVRRQLARLAKEQGDYDRAEKVLRDVVRVLTGLGNRGLLCEAQRQLAQVLAAQGKVAEAERYALEARETVGPEDRVSLSTTKMALGVVRAAQGRDEEAEALLRGAADELARPAFRLSEVEALAELVRFYRDRGRDDEAARYEARLAELSPSSTAPIA
jgi:tetratricopeptide (TPR) repeat protein